MVRELKNVENTRSRPPARGLSGEVQYLPLSLRCKNSLLTFYTLSEETLNVPKYEVGIMHLINAQLLERPLNWITKP